MFDNVAPTSYVDALALKHDIEYLSDGEKFASDLSAVYNSDWSVQGIAMKIGLLSRVGLDAITHLIPFAPKFHLNGRTDKLNVKTIDLQRKLARLAKPHLARYGVDSSTWNF